MPITQDYETLTERSLYNPTTTQFDENKGAAGRVAQITSSGSPLMQLAQTRGLEQANRSGLRNSSMAVGAAQKSVIDAATPLATTDASLYEQRTKANQDAMNQAGQFNSSTRATLGSEGLKLAEGSRQFDTSAGLESRKTDINEAQFGQTIGEQQRQFDQSAGLEREKMVQQAGQYEAGLANQRTLAQMDADNRLALAGIEADYKNEIAGNENISQAWGTMMQSVSQIQNNPDLNSATKKTLIENTLEGFRSFAGFWNGISNVDVGDLLSFGQTTPVNTGDTEARADPPQTPAGGYVPAPGWEDPFKWGT